jgi:predicted cupin superfamily sugar epimerase
VLSEEPAALFLIMLYHPTSMSPDIESLKSLHSLQKHPEGGWYREIYRSASLTSIYFLLPQQEVSRWHKVEADEAWHFYEGAPLELVLYHPHTKLLERVILSSSREDPSVHIVPAGVWQAATSMGTYSLVGCTVAPAFNFSLFTLIDSALPDYEALTQADARFR